MSVQQNLDKSCYLPNYGFQWKIQSHKLLQEILRLLPKRWPGIAEVHDAWKVGWAEKAIICFISVCRLSIIMSTRIF